MDMRTHNHAILCIRSSLVQARLAAPVFLCAHVSACKSVRVCVCVCCVHVYRVCCSLTSNVISRTQSHSHTWVRFQLIECVVETLQRCGLDDEIEYEVIQHKG